MTQQTTPERFATDRFAASGRVGARRPQTAWARAKMMLLSYWDHPPAILFWLVFTALTIAVLKGAGL
jgi:hypothetical protein